MAQDDRIQIGGHTNATIVDENQMYGTVQTRQGVNVVHIFVRDLDEYIDGLITVRNSIKHLKEPR